MSSLNDVLKTEIKFWDDLTIVIVNDERQYTHENFSWEFRFLSSSSNIAVLRDLPNGHAAFTFYFYKIPKTNQTMKRLEFHFQECMLLTMFHDSTIVEFVTCSNSVSKMKIDLKNLFLTSSVLNS